MSGPACEYEWGDYDGMFGVECELPRGHAGPHIAMAGGTDSEREAVLAALALFVEGDDSGT